MSTVDIDKLALILTAFANEAIRSDNPKLLHDEIVSALTQYRTHLKAELLAKIDTLISYRMGLHEVQKWNERPVLHQYSPNIRPDHIAQRYLDGLYDARTEITKIVNEL